MANENRSDQENLTDEQQQEQQRSRADINRENSLRSTGPRTPEGRAISSQNALKHGAYRALTVDDLATVSEIFRDFCRDFKPEGVTEQLYVRQMAEAHYRGLLITRWVMGMMEDYYIQHPIENQDPCSMDAAMEDYRAFKANKKELDSFDRQQERFLNRYERAFRRLQLMQKMRKVEEARIARSGEDRTTHLAMRGKLWDVTFGLFASLVNVRNEARLKALEPTRKVEIPPEQEKQ